MLALGAFLCPHRGRRLRRGPGNAVAKVDWTTNREEASSTCMTVPHRRVRPPPAATRAYTACMPERRPSLKRPRHPKSRRPAQYHASGLQRLLEHVLKR